MGTGRGVEGRLGGANETSQKSGARGRGRGAFIVMQADCWISGTDVRPVCAVPGIDTACIRVKARLYGRGPDDPRAKSPKCDAAHEIRVQVLTERAACGESFWIGIGRNASQVSTRRAPSPVNPVGIRRTALRFCKREAKPR